jgi:hypothetical protein
VIQSVGPEVQRPTIGNVEVPIVLWIVGEPGIGKTCLARRILLEYGPPNAEVRKPKWTIFGWYARTDAVAVGTWRGDAFDGGDTVPIGDIKPALAHWAEHFAGGRAPASPLVLFDGDKFANANAVYFVERRTKSARFAQEFPGLVVTLTREEIATLAGFPTTWCVGCLELSEDGADHDCIGFETATDPV